jgi:hypothetical protein
MRRLSIFRLAILAGLLLSTAPAGAFVTSATLEYSAPHPVKFYLNGTEIKNYDSQFPRFFEYDLICSSDGSLPLELFKYKSENVLAIYQKGQGGWEQFTNMGVSYRLTIYQSAGAPVVVWSEPGNTKFLHLNPGQDLPVGWEKPGFDDAKWQEGISARMITDYWGWAELPDPAFRGALGNEGFVPFLSNNRTGAASAGMINIFRSTFRLPDKPGKLVVYPYTPKPKQGDKVLVSLIPARDSASMGNLQVSAVLPKGLDPLQAPGASFDAATRTLNWRYPSPSKSLATNIESVVENNGFVQAQKAFGPWKPNRPPKDYVRGITLEQYYDSATFPSGASGWFKMSAPPFKDSPKAPYILSVTFMCQYQPQGFNGLIEYSVEHIMFNYSVDGSLKGVKPDKGVNITKTSVSQSGQYWNKGYYDATYDRHWTWSDLENLKVYFFAKQVGARKLDNRLLSCIASVRYYDPNDVKPYFYATLSESGCKALTISATIKSLVNDASSSGSAVIMASNNCAPTPTPTYTPRPTPVPTYPPPPPGATPRPTPTTRPTPVPTAPPSKAPGIKDVNSSPEPFKRGGVYVQFSINNSVTGLKLNVFGASGQVVVSVDGGAFAAGPNQIFFDGLDAKKRALAPGKYQYEIEASVGDSKESFRGSFTKASDKFQ